MLIDFYMLSWEWWPLWLISYMIVGAFFQGFFKPWYVRLAWFMFWPILVPGLFWWF